MTRLLIVIPTLNEAAHIGPLLQGLLPFAERRAARIVVADGGSTDGTPGIVRDLAARSSRILLLHNPDRLQSAAVNHAVAAHGAGADWLLRLDAHSSYPPDYGDVLLDEAQASGADAVVVSMLATGFAPLQSVIALAQNSRLGNGGAAHRNATAGRWVDHGHHALMRLAAFRAVGGYDPQFSHNEDAELDHRLRAAGHRIWLTAATQVTYFPRRTLSALMRQYFNFGRGRARNLRKHRIWPGPRQAVVAALAPLLALAVLAPLAPVFALPLLLWGLGCLTGGLWIGGASQLGAGRSAPARLWRGVQAGVVAGLMHLAWSAGFWAQIWRAPPPASAAGPGGSIFSAGG